MSQNKFRRRMLLAAVLPTLIFTVLLSLVWVSWFQQELVDSRTEKTEAIARQLATAAEFHLFSRDAAALSALLDAVSAEEADISGVAIYDPRDGQIAGKGAAVSLPGGVSQAVWSDAGRAGNRRLVMPIKELSLAIDDLSTGDHVAGTAGTEGQLVGYVVLEVSDTALVKKRNYILIVAVILIVVAMLAGGLLAAYLAKGITHSIGRSTAVVQSIGRGDLGARIDADPDSVLFPLEQGINQMAERVAMTQEDLQRRIDMATAELQSQKNHAEQEARLDALTQLGNRRAFAEHGESEVQRAQRYDKPLALVVLDLDLFKQVNDQYGHDVGDLVLVKLSESLCRQMREVDFVARLGGEEFAILMPDTGAEEAVQVAERLRQAVTELAIEANGALIRCTASFGVTEFQPGDTRIQDLYVRADQALYRAKQAGRNRVER